MPCEADRCRSAQRQVQRRGNFIMTAIRCVAACVCLALPSALAHADPLKVGTAKQLFIDDRFLQDAKGVKLTVNRPRPTGEKLIVMEKPWEDYYIGAYVSVIQERDRIHLWYEPMDKRKKTSSLAYAFSDDGGATFKKPELG